MPSYITDTFKPHPRVLQNLRKLGAVPEFIEDQFDSFMMYWQKKRDKGLKTGLKTDWDKTFYNWMKSDWNGPQGRRWERERHFRMGGKTNGFQDMLDRFGGDVEPDLPDSPPVCHAPPLENSCDTRHQGIAERNPVATPRGLSRRQLPAGKLEDEAKDGPYPPLDYIKQASINAAPRSNENLSPEEELAKMRRILDMPLEER